MTDKLQNKETPEQSSEVSVPNQNIAPSQNNNKGSYFNGGAWRAMKEMANTFIQSGAMPAHIKNAAQLMVIMQTGKELGMFPMESINSLYMVNGKVALQGVAMLKKVLEAGVEVEWVKSSDQEAEVKFSGLNRPDYISSFTIDEAKKAGLLGKPGPWHQYPKNMLRWRALANGARIFCPDVIQGLHTIEELTQVNMVEDGTFTPIQQISQPQPSIKEEPKKLGPTEEAKPVEVPKPKYVEGAIVEAKEPEPKEPPSQSMINLTRSLLAQKEGVDPKDENTVLGMISLMLDRDINSFQDLDQREIKKINQRLMDKKTVRHDENLNKT